MKCERRRRLLRELAKAAIQVAEVVSLGYIAEALGDTVGATNSDGDAQKRLDITANEIFIEALRNAPVAAVLSEELNSPLCLDPDAPLAVAIDPLDGSSNIDANVSIGTIFAVFPAVERATEPANHFLRPGREQIAAGFVIYGPQTSLVFTLGDGVQVFTLDRKAGVFQLTIPRLAIPHDSHEYAVNASNYRHWDESIRAYLDDCIRGSDGPLAQDYNMRWIASLVADAYRILVRGGVFLYPGDQRRRLYEGAAAADLRSEPDRVSGRASRGQLHGHGAAHPGYQAARIARANADRFRLDGSCATHQPVPHRSAVFRRALTALFSSVACSGDERSAPRCPLSIPLFP